MILWYGNKALINYSKKAAIAAGPLLDLLEKEGWPDRKVYVPENLRPGLRSMIKRLNQKLAGSPVKLHSGGDGNSVSWTNDTMRDG